MAQIKNISPLGDLHVPSFNLEVKAGATVEVSDEVATSLLEQSENWAPADAAANNIAVNHTSSAPDAPVAPVN